MCPGRLRQQLQGKMAGGQESEAAVVLPPDDPANALVALWQYAVLQANFSLHPLLMLHAAFAAATDTCLCIHVKADSADATRWTFQLQLLCWHSACMPVTMPSLIHQATDR